MKTTTIYKIEANDGSYSKGGSHPSFSKNGKIWTKKSHLSNHLSYLSEMGRNIYTRRGAKIVEFEVTETPTGVCSIDDWIAGVVSRREERNQSIKKRREISKLESNIAQLQKQLSDLKNER